MPFYKYFSLARVWEKFVCADVVLDVYSRLDSKFNFFKWLEEFKCLEEFVGWCSKSPLHGFLLISKEFAY